jgi:selenocysteine-specific elongation factor
VSQLVVGVLGHVDHGKTALVRALTGMETDRLAEEKRRGISIVLGFAHLALPDGSVVDLIDMPGHEDFVRTMVSGATGMDVALLVVAANEGIKPQTAEHLAIAALLGVRRVLVAVSKADLASAVPVGREVAALVTGWGLELVGSLAVSAETGQGVAELRAALAGMEADPPGDAGFPFLAVDRAFSIAGHGTVVTGTLRRGAIAVGDELELLPSLVPVRVRGLEVRNRRVTLAAPGQRVAVNLRGVAPSAIARGTAVSARGLLPPARWLTVWLRAVPGAPALATTTRLRLLIGTAELDARLRLLEADEPAPGSVGLAQLHCAQPISVPAGEHFILRTASPATTMAGGRVLDPEAVRLRRHDASILAHVNELVWASSAGIVAAEVAAAGLRGVMRARLARLTGLAPARVAALCQDAFLLVPRGDLAVSRADFAALLQRLPALAAEGLTRTQLAARLAKVGEAVLDDAVGLLVARGALRQAGGMIRRADPRAEQNAAQREAAEAHSLAEALRQAGLTPPDPAVIAPGPQARRLLDRLVREGVAVRAIDQTQRREFLFHAEAVAAAQRCLAPALVGEGLKVAEAGAMLGISRKYSVPLLAYFDSIHFTRRVADRRVRGAEPPR